MNFTTMWCESELINDRWKMFQMLVEGQPPRADGA